MNLAADILETIATRIHWRAVRAGDGGAHCGGNLGQGRAKAVILPDGTFSKGWIGGGCARAAVLKAAKDALADGKARLVSVAPEEVLTGQGHTTGEEGGGVRFAKNMCPSQGTMDIFVEPVLPRPDVVICG